MFCPNCGTQNPETAHTCGKCNFNLKGAAAPKFKGTMLMQQAPQVTAPQARPPEPAPVGAPAPATSAMPSKLKGTMVGVAPPMPGSAPMGPGPMMGGGPPPADPGFPPPAGGMGGMGGGGMGGYGAPAAPPADHGTFGSHAAGVNPLGGTMVAPDGGFGAPAPGPGGYGAPPPGPGGYGAPPPGGGGYGAPPPGGYPTPQYGAPDPTAGGYGAPTPQYGAADPNAGGYGAPQGGFGAPPGAPGPGGYGGPTAQGGYGGPPPQGGGYGAPAGQDFGQQMQQGFNQATDAINQGINQALGSGGGYGQPQQQQPYGAPGGAMQPMGGYAGGPMMQVGGGAPGGHGPKGQVKNPMTSALLVAFVPFYGVIWFIGVCNEIKAYLQRDEPNWVTVFLLGMVTCGLYSLYWMIMKLGPMVQEMQQRAGVQNPENRGIFYLIPIYGVMCLHEDLNKVWQSPN